MSVYYVDIVQCSDGTYYTGFTSNLEKRIAEHNSGKYGNSYTLKRRPVELKWIEQFTDPTQAFKIEKQIKEWTHCKKLALIQQDWNKLIEYSKNKRTENEIEFRIDSDPIFQIAQSDNQV